MESINQSGSPQAYQPDVTLETPERSTGPADSFLLKPKEIKHWVNDLPIANIGETARQVYKTLVNFNRIDMPTLVRAEAVELFREPVRFVNSNMTRHYAESGFPLSSKAKKASQLSYELCAEIAIAYKIIVSEQLEPGNTKFDQKLVIVAIHRALQYLGQALFHSYLSYSNPKPGVWREIHFLYTWAAQNHVHTIPVKESVKQRWRQQNRSIEDLYLSYVLMSTTSPHRLRQSQIRRVHDRLNEWSKLTKVVPLQSTSHNSGVFYLNLWSDNPPLKSINAGEKRDSRFRAFDLSTLLGMLRDDFDNSSWESPTRLEDPGELLPRSLLRLLIRGWNKSQERRFARTQLNIELDVVIGLSTLHHLLDQEKHTSTPMSTEAEETPSPTPPAGNLSWNDSVFSTLAIASPVKGSQGDSIFADSMNIASTLLGESSNGTNWVTQKPTDINELFSVLTYNESAEGYCLSWQGTVQPKVRVGDMLGIRSDNTPGEYSLGIIRWLKYLQDDRLYLGVQIISPTCDSATLVPSAKTSSNLKNHFRCLLLNGDGLDKDHLGLITDTREFELNTVSTLVTEFGSHQIMLTDWVESSNSFIHYQFEYVEDIQPATSDESAKKDQQSDFNELWDDL